MTKTSALLNDTCIFVMHTQEHSTVILDGTGLNNLQLVILKCVVSLVGALIALAAAATHSRLLLSLLLKNICKNENVASGLT